MVKDNRAEALIFVLCKIDHPMLYEDYGLRGASVPDNLSSKVGSNAPLIVSLLPYSPLPPVVECLSLAATRGGIPGGQSFIPV